MTWRSLCGTQRHLNAEPIINQIIKAFHLLNRRLNRPKDIAPLPLLEATLHEKERIEAANGKARQTPS